MKKLLTTLAILLIATASYAQTYTVNGGNVPIQAEFSNKIVYAVNDGTDSSALKNDCSKRGGVFNECGSVCDEGDVCIRVCAFTCELKDKVTPAYVVKHVIDGDTIVVTDSEGKSEEVQLIGIKTPPIVFPEGIDPVLYDPPFEVLEEAGKWGDDLEAVTKMGAGGDGVC